MPNLIATFTGARPGRHLVLNGHLDVFPIGDRSVWKRDPLSGDVVGDAIDRRVYGRGTVDMKCGTTALLFVFAYLHRLRAELPGRVTLTVVSDEETGGKWGADWLVRNCADEVLGDCVLNTEPSGVHTVRFGEKSMLWLRFRIAVPGGHSAYPHTSPSANKIAASLIKDLEMIEAMAPDEPAVVRDVRPPVGITRAAVLDKVKAIVMRYPMVTFEELLAGNPESTWSDPTHEMVGHLTRNAAEALGYPPQPIVSLGGTDTRFWRRAGVPAFVYGCSPAGMGGIDEAVSIAEFHHVLRVHALAAVDYLGTVPANQEGQ